MTKAAPRRVLARFFAVPPDVDAAAPPTERNVVTGIIEGVLPLSERLPGIGHETIADLETWPLEEIAVPVLIVAAADDLYNTLPGARLMAERVRNAKLVVLPSGGHLLVGRHDEVRREVDDFLAAVGAAGGRGIGAQSAG